MFFDASSYPFDLHILRWTFIPSYMNTSGAMRNSLSCAMLMLMLTAVIRPRSPKGHMNATDGACFLRVGAEVRKEQGGGYGKYENTKTNTDARGEFDVGSLQRCVAHSGLAVRARPSARRAHAPTAAASRVAITDHRPQQQQLTLSSILEEKKGGRE